MSFAAVLWDFGGVITDSPFDAFNRYEAAHGLRRDFIRSVNAVNHQDNAWAKFESSRISVDEFDVLFAGETAAAGHEIRGREVIGLLGGDVRPRMVKVLQRCKQDYRIACLTNNANAGTGGDAAGCSCDLAKRTSSGSGALALVAIGWLGLRRRRRSRGAL